MERRKHQRAPLAFPIRLRIGNIDDFTEEHTSDLSAGGIFVRMNYPPPVGTHVDLEFFLEPVQKLIKARGTVVRSIPEGEADSGPPGMGVQFTDIGHEGRRFIELVVQKYNRSHPSGVIDLPPGFLEDVDAEIEANKAPQPTGTNLQIRLKLPDRERFLKAHGERLREGKMVIHTDARRPVGTKVHLQILLEKENLWVSAEGEVTGCTGSSDKGGGAGRPGIHLKISEPSAELQRLIQQASSVPS